MKQVFVSYHFTEKNGRFNGFGNYLGQFDDDAYLNDMRKFILDLEEMIAKEVGDKIDAAVVVKVLYFR